MNNLTLSESYKSPDKVTSQVTEAKVCRSSHRIADFYPFFLSFGVYIARKLSQYRFL